MSLINPEHNPTTLHKEYMAAAPFPHIVLDNFLDPWVAEQSLLELEKSNIFSWNTDHHADQVKKYWMDKPEQLPQTTGFLLRYLNSPAVLKFMSELTGIPDLLPDPAYQGGGVHVTLPGGFLSVHADFNLQEKTKLHRRVNTLIYLNQDWEEEWNGCLELWERDMSRCVRRVAPLFNRVAVFNITDDAYHGVPDPLACPIHRKRFSLALYYYTKERPEHEKSDFHWALWQKRPT